METVLAVTRGDLIAALVGSGWTLLTLGFAVSVIVGKLRSGRLAGAVEQSGITFRPDPIVAWIIGCSFLGGVLASGLTLLFRGRNGVALPFSSMGRLNEPLLMAALLALAVFGLGALIVHGKGHLRLTPAGIENTEMFHARTASWEEVTAITDTAPQKPRRQPISLFVDDDERPIVVANAGGYAASGAALYWMIRHYWLHPENRGELADGRALSRLSEEDFVPE